MVDTLGKKLLDFCGKAEGNLLLVAPFIKANVIERIVDILPEYEINFQCVTRWRPEEIAAGVSDLEVYEIVNNRIGGDLYIHPFLHAKYFRSGNKCLIGSANLTFKALGWSIPENLELLVEEEQINFLNFENRLFRTAFKATKELREEIEKLAEKFKKDDIKIYLSEEAKNEEESTDVGFRTWLPLCPRPDQLYEIYTAQNTEHIIGWTLRAGKTDIQALKIPSGLTNLSFKKFLSTSLQQTSILQSLYDSSKYPINSSAGKSLIIEEVREENLTYSLEEHWEILRKWVLYFLPNVYRVPTGTDMLQRGTVIAEI